MRNVILTVQSNDMLAALTALQVWGEKTGFEIIAVAGNVEILDKMTDSQQFDLLIIEADLAAKDDFRVVKKIIHDNTCEHIAFCSREGDFLSARAGIQLGVKEYFTYPLESQNFLVVFDKIKAGDGNQQANVEKAVKELVYYFETQAADFYEYLERLTGSSSFPRIVDLSVKEIFRQNEWMDLYFNEDFFYVTNTLNIAGQKERFIHLFESVCRLYPRHNDSLNEVILHILYNPESDLRQKKLSENLHLNQSYLSTVFTAQTGLRFVDYITYVKLVRAAWLLRNTNMKIGEVAERMDYKDIAYFSKLFKKHFHATPAEYKIPDSYHFII
ncbi:MAG: helix-turn-helix transcriptional regulator [Lachnospiraceae bacterium]|nr:helix-turn-helix transcriptional regulator [Lachnospiraceae bacterium]